MGRFLSPDPTVEAPFIPQDLNRYSYAGNNPLSFTDPSGYDFIATVTVTAAPENPIIAVVAIVAEVLVDIFGGLFGSAHVAILPATITVAQAPVAFSPAAGGSPSGMTAPQNTAAAGTSKGVETVVVTGHVAENSAAGFTQAAQYAGLTATSASDIISSQASEPTARSQALSSDANQPPPPSNAVADSNIPTIHVTATPLPSNELLVAPASVPASEVANSLSCRPAASFFAKVANVADTISNGASLVSLGAGAAALATSETVVGGLTFGGISAAAGAVSLTATGVATAANVIAGRYGNAGVDVFSMAWDAGTDVAAKMLPRPVQLLRQGVGQLMSQSASAMCPG